MSVNMMAASFRCSIGSLALMRVFSTSILLSCEMRVEELQYPFILIHPAGRFDEPMVLQGIRRKFPVFLLQLNQPLCQPHGVLEMHIDVDHPVADQQRSLESLRMIN